MLNGRVFVLPFIPNGNKQLPRGIAFLDFLIVVVILGIAAMIALPQLYSVLAEEKLISAAREIDSALQYARSLAVRHQRHFAVTADVAGNWFGVCESAVTPPLPGDPQVQAEDKCILQGNPEGYVVLNPFEKKWYIKDFDEIDTFQGVKITAVPSGNQVVFYPDGHTGLSESVFVVTLNDRQKTITVDGMTGRVTVQ